MAAARPQITGRELQGSTDSPAPAGDQQCRGESIPAARRARCPRAGAAGQQGREQHDQRRPQVVDPDSASTGGVRRARRVQGRGSRTARQVASASVPVCAHRAEAGAAPAALQASAERRRRSRSSTQHEEPAARRSAWSARERDHSAIRREPAQRRAAVFTSRRVAAAQPRRRGSRPATAPETSTRTRGTERPRGVPSTW